MAEKYFITSYRPERRTPIRQPLSKRLRFEILRRDHFTCQYCGKRAPEAELHIDHRVSVLHGGTNDRLNLVTACIDCNLGKSWRSVRIRLDSTFAERTIAAIERAYERVFDDLVLSPNPDEDFAESRYWPGVDFDPNERSEWEYA